jgi:hypothetical protein
MCNPESSLHPEKRKVPEARITIGHEPGSHEAVEESAPHDFHLEGEIDVCCNRCMDAQPNMNVYCHHGREWRLGYRFFGLP